MILIFPTSLHIFLPQLRLTTIFKLSKTTTPALIGPDMCSRIRTVRTNTSGINEESPKTGFSHKARCNATRDIPRETGNRHRTALGFNGRSFVPTDYGKGLSGPCDQNPAAAAAVIGDIYRHRNDRILITVYVTVGKNKKLGARSNHAALSAPRVIVSASAQ